MTVILYVASSGRAMGHEFVGSLVTVEIVFQYARNLPK